MASACDNSIDSIIKDIREAINPVIDFTDYSDHQPKTESLYLSMLYAEEDINAVNTAAALLATMDSFGYETVSQGAVASKKSKNSGQTIDKETRIKMSAARKAEKELQKEKYNNARKPRTSSAHVIPYSTPINSPDYCSVLECCEYVPCQYHPTQYITGNL